MLQSTDKNVCCLDHPDKPLTPLSIANYDCSQLEPYGKDRCNQVWGGNTCSWNEGKICRKMENKCNRISFYESHNQQVIDVGKCSGLCKNKNQKCKPKEYSLVVVENDNIDVESYKVKVIKSCYCDECLAVPKSQLIEIETGKCDGNCNKQQSKLCQAGVNDNFSLSNGLEVSNPSTLLLSGILSSCSAGIQNGFDHFIDNRCFGHTFTNCFELGTCPLRYANLRICMRAAQVPLTNTDSLILGINGSPLWSKSLPDLNSGTWNPGNTLCLDLNLGNLPIDGANILNLVGSTGHLDVAVQDDTAVDYLDLKIQYEDCQKCLPVNTYINTLYHDSGISNYLNVKDCDCINMSKCHRADYFEVHFPGTIFETTVDRGQCVGKCPNFLRCSPDEIIKSTIKAPEGSKEISKIVSCKCSKILWNSLAVRD